LTVDPYGNNLVSIEHNILCPTNAGKGLILALTASKFIHGERGSFPLKKVSQNNTRGLLREKWENIDQ